MASRNGRMSDLPAQDVEGSSLLSLARKTQQARIQCSPDFPKHVFRDSAWDIMLELFIVAEQGHRMCVKETMAISGESATGTIRRLESLEEANLVFRRYDPGDHRRVLVELSGKGRAAMVSFLHHLFETSEEAAQREKAIKPISFVPQSPRWPDGSLRDCS